MNTAEAIERIKTLGEDTLRQANKGGDAVQRLSIFLILIDSAIQTGMDDDVHEVLGILKGYNRLGHKNVVRSILIALHWDADGMMKDWDEECE